MKDAARPQSGRRQHVLHRGVRQHVKHGNDADARDQRNRDRALRPPDLSAHHVQVVPAVIGPQRRHQRRHESCDAAGRPCKVRAEILPRSAGGRESDDANADDHHHLQDGEDQLELSGSFHADVVQPGDERGGGDRHQLSIGNDERHSDGRIVEECQRRKCTENAHDSRSDRRYRSGLGDDEPRPRHTEMPAAVRRHRECRCTRRRPAASSRPARRR